MNNKCPNCGSMLDDGKCDYCGYEEKNYKREFYSDDLDKKTRQINTYMNEINGTRENNYVVSYKSPKSNTIALLTCIFLGVIGVHRFYVGKVGTGILYIFTGGLCGIGVIVDIIKILTGSFKDSEGLTLTW